MVKIKMKPLSIIPKINAQVILIVCFLVLSSGLQAQSFKQDKTVIANGASKASSTTFQTKVTIGQNVLGKGSSTSFIVNQGFEFLSSSDKAFDLALENLVLDPTTVGPGNQVQISVDIRNLGESTITAGSFEIGVYLSFDQIIGGGEEFLTTFTPSGNIEPGGTYSFPQASDFSSATISGVNAGTWYIILRADDGDQIAELDETNNEISSTINITGDSTPPVLANYTTVNHYSTGSSVSVSVTDNVGVQQVNFYHRGITTPESQPWALTENVTAVSGVYTVELQASWLDNQGVEYWFEAFDTSNNKDSTAVGYTYFQTVGGELLLPSMKKGRTVADYEMISIPFDLSQKSPLTVFSVFGDKYDPKEWRIFHYTGGSTKEYNAGWTLMEIGKSYWVINDISSVNTIQVGEGKAPSSNKTSPYTISLVQGWNQIGNPYRFDVSWNDIMTASGNPAAVEDFRTWSGGNFADGTTLKTFGGGFVYTTAPATLSIPITPPVGSSTKQINARVKKITNPIDDDNWEVNFILSNDQQAFRYGGFGMREDASISKDYYDEVGSPRFVEYLEMNFDHPEYFIPRFSKDIIPPSDDHQWEFRVESNSEPRLTSLLWDNSYFGDNEVELYLFDESKQHFVDMREVNEYTFTLNETNLFRVFYGSAEFIENTLNPNRVLLGNNYPNPFVKYTVIPFTLPPAESSYEVELRIYNQLGKEVNKLLKGTYQEGFYELEWNGTNLDGQRVPAGIYLYQIIVTNKGLKVIQTGKMAVY